MIESETVPGVPKGLVTAAGWMWRLIVVIAGIATVALILFELRIVTVPIFIALLATTLLLPPVRVLERRGFPTGVAMFTVFLSLAVATVVLVYLLASPVASQFNDLGPQAQQAVDDINDWLVTGPLDLSQTEIDQYIDQATAQVTANASVLSSGLLSSATIAVEIAVGLLVSLILTIFFIKDGDMLVNAVIGRFSVRHRATAHAAAHRAFTVLGGYLRGVAMTGVVDAVLIGLALVIIGVPLVLPLVILTFFGAFFPVVGATIAGALAAMIALVNGGVGDAVLVLLAVIIVQQVEGHVLQPLLVGRAVSLHPVVIIVALVTGSIVAGLLGAFIAVPLTAVIVGMVREIEQHRLAEAGFTKPG